MSPNQEVEDLITTLQDSQGFRVIHQLVRQEIARYYEQNLQEFRKAIAHQESGLIESFQQELAKVQQESTTIKGLMARLERAIVPDIPNQDEIVTIQQAIDNLEKYGHIIPSSQKVAEVNAQLQVQRNWSILRQSLIRFVLKKLEVLFENRSLS